MPEGCTDLQPLFSASLLENIETWKRNSTRTLVHARTHALRNVNHAPTLSTVLEAFALIMIHRGACTVCSVCFRQKRWEEKRLQRKSLTNMCT